MPPEISNFFLKNSQEYHQGFKDGHTHAMNKMEKEIELFIKSVKNKVKNFVEDSYTATSESKDDIL